ncbi:MAG: hypothetical protein HC772_08385 [Leptolyngbyaceae cyanobacterium CRU_2_3]|nr:hypothetical protein [Leptolyngbyaceae cyanobacterium CRU_2_3]
MIGVQNLLAALIQGNADLERHPQRTPQAKARVILLGTPEDVSSVIYELYQRGFAEVAVWSPLQPIPDSGEIIRLLIRRFGRSPSSV